MAASIYKYVVYAVNTTTKQKHIVCKVRSYGDVPLIISGLKKGITTSPIKYTYEKI